MNEHAIPSTPRWLHLWAVGTVCATFVLLLLGSLVTTKGVGMADPIWPTYPWHLWLVGWTEPRPGFIIEHSHRLAGYIVGVCTIVLAVGLWKFDTRKWVGWLGFAALAGVIFQGLLGGFRVVLDRLVGTDLALIHGCFAQIVFALLVSVAIVTSRGWQSTRELSNTGLRRATLAAACLVYLQIIFGAVVRHTYSMTGLRLHLLGAFLAAVAIVWVVREAWQSRDWLARWIALVLGGVTALQVALGVEAFMGRMLARSPAHQLGVRTAHVLTGFLVFASCVALALVVRRNVPAAEPEQETERELALAGVVEGQA